MLLFENILLLIILSLIIFRNQRYMTTIIILIFSVFALYHIFPKKQIVIQENMVGTLSGGLESTLKSGVVKLIDEAAKTASSEFIIAVNEKFSDMSVKDKNIMKKKINQIIDNLHFINNKFKDNEKESTQKIDNYNDDDNDNDT